MVSCVLGLFTSFAYWRVAWSTLAFIALFIDHIVLGFLHCLEDTNQIFLLLYFYRVEHFMKPSFKKATNSDTSVLGCFIWTLRWYFLFGVLRKWDREEREKEERALRNCSPPPHQFQFRIFCCIAGKAW